MVIRMTPIYGIEIDNGRLREWYIQGHEITTGPWQVLTDARPGQWYDTRLVEDE